MRSHAVISVVKLYEEYEYGATVAETEKQLSVVDDPKNGC